MTLPSSEPIPTTPQDHITDARRRRVKRSNETITDDQHTEWLQNLTRTLSPSFDFYLSCLLSGLTIAIGLLLQSDAILILGVLFAPFLGPLLGISFSAVAGSLKLLIKSILKLAAGGFFVFGAGALSGALLPILKQRPIPIVTTWTAFQWPNFLLLAIGSALCVVMLVRSPRQRPLVANIAMAYGLFPSLAAAGFNLVAYNDTAWLAGITMTGVHVVWTVLVGILVFLVLGHPPRKLSGFLLIALLLGLLTGAFINARGSQTPGMTPRPTLPAIVHQESSIATKAPTQTGTPVPSPVTSPTQTLTPTITFAPTSTATQTITPQPTPVWARVEASSGGGALLRDNPDGKIISSLLNGSLLEVISDPVRGTGGIIWVQVRTENNVVGWIVQSLLATATPAAGW